MHLDVDIPFALRMTGEVGEPNSLTGVSFKINKIE